MKSDIKILKAKTIKVKKWVTVTVAYKNLFFKVHVECIDGMVSGNPESGLYTHVLEYFNTVPLSIRKKHFEQIKKYVERYIK